MLIAIPPDVCGQDRLLRTASLPADYRLDLNVSYPTDGSFKGRLDVYARKGTGSRPVVIWWHGANQDKEYMRWLIPPLLELGFNIVVPQAADSPTDPSPPSANAAMRRISADRCALRWTLEHAADYGFDTGRLIIGGISLGGYTALMSSLVNSQDGFDQACPGGSEMQASAIIDFFGPTRLPDGTEGDTPRIRALTYIRKNQPPVFIVHGDADQNVPHSQSVELATALQRAGVVHEFITIPKGRHGLVTWEPEQLQSVWSRLQSFLAKRALLP